jgi:hypothetical protein
MSALVADLRAVGASIRNRVSEWVRQLRRTKPGPVLARLISGVSALAACVVVLPPVVLTSAKVLLVIPVALGVSLWPRTRWVTLVAVLCLGGWLVATLSEVVAPDPARVAVLAAALYLMHAGAALAAVLPHDCVVSPGVLLRWGLRVGSVVAVSLAIGISGMIGATQLTSARSVVGPIVGSIVVASLVGLLVWQVRLRR